MKRCTQCNQEFDDALESCPFCSSIDTEQAEKAPEENIFENADAQENAVNEALDQAEDTASDNNAETEEAVDGGDDEAYTGSSETYAESSETYTPAPRSKSKLGLYIFLAVAAVAAIAAIVYLYIFKVVPSAPVTTLYESQYVADMDTYFSYIYPPNAESAKSDFLQSYDSADDYKEQLSSSLKQSFGEDYKVTVRALDVESASADVMAKMIEGQEDEQKALITDMAFVTVKIKIEGSENTNMFSNTHTVLKYDGSWYVYQ